MAADGTTGTNGITYRLDPPATPGGAWHFTALHAFSGASGTAGGALPDGAFPNGRLVLGYKHHLYGITAAGGRFGQGTIYEQTLY